MSILLLTLILATVIVAYRYSPADTTGLRPALSAYTVILASFSVYVVLSAGLIILNGGTFEWAPAYQSSAAFDRSLTICLVALLVFLLSYHILFAIGRNGTTRVPSAAVRQALTRRDGGAGIHRESGEDRTRPLAYWLLLLGVLLKIYLVAKSGGVDTNIVRASSGARTTSQISQIGNGLNAIRTASGIADAAAAWLVMLALRRKEPLKRPLLVFIAILMLSYITIGKRLVLILPIAAVAIAYHRYRRPISVKTLPLVIALALLLGMGSLFFRIFVPAALTGSRIDLNQIPYARGSTVRFYFYSLEFSSVEMITVATSSPSSITDAFGGISPTFYLTNVQPLAYGVPRAVWPGKPTLFLDVSYAIASDLTGTPLRDTQAGYASTIIGTSWLYGGYIGEIFFIAFLALLCRLIDRVLRKSDWPCARILTFAFLLTAVFYYFRQGTIGWVFIIAVIQQLGILLGFVVLAVGARSMSRGASTQGTQQTQGRAPNQESRRLEGGRQ